MRTNRIIVFILLVLVCILKRTMHLLLGKYCRYFLNIPIKDAILTERGDCSMSETKMLHPAYCGFDCAKCPVYIASETGDEKLKRELIERFSEGTESIGFEQIECHGCKSDIPSGHRFCSECEFRTCARRRGISSWASAAAIPARASSGVFPSAARAEACLTRSMGRAAHRPKNSLLLYRKCV